MILHFWLWFQWQHSLNPSVSPKRKLFHNIILYEDWLSWSLQLHLKLYFFILIICLPVKIFRSVFFNFQLQISKLPFNINFLNQIFVFPLLSSVFLFILSLHNFVCFCFQLLSIVCIPWCSVPSSGCWPNKRIWFLQY